MIQFNLFRVISALLVLIVVLMICPIRIKHSVWYRFSNEISRHELYDTVESVSRLLPKLRLSTPGNRFHTVSDQTSLLPHIDSCHVLNNTCQSED
jgi:hypothetical protein